MLNVVALVGRLTKDPETKVIGNDTKVCNFTLAVNRPFKDESGEQVCDFIMCQAWNKQADFIGTYLKKGQLIGVEGAIHTRTYEKPDQTTAYVTEINVNQVRALESKRDNEVTEESLRKAWTDEWNEKSKDLKGLQKDKLKKDLTAKYQPQIDALLVPSDAKAEKDLPF